MSRKKTVSLVLGSGGARGYAHIGVIEELMKHGYQIRSISGSSMGALMGGLYACSKLDAYKEWVLTLDMLDVVQLLDFSFSTRGIIQGDKVFKIIEKMIGDVLIEELAISFTAVATDINKQREVWIQKGRLIDALRASIAIPTIFTPMRLDGRELIDGGVLNPIPIAPTLLDNTDMTIVVNLDAKVNKKYSIKIPKKQSEKDSGIQKAFSSFIEKTEKLISKEPKEKSDELGMFGIIGHTIDTMQKALSEYKIAGYYPDMVINIPHDACGFYEFNRAYEIIELGRVITKEELQKNGF